MLFFVGKLKNFIWQTVQATNTDNSNTISINLSLDNDLVNTSVILNFDHYLTH